MKSFAMHCWIEVWILSTLGLNYDKKKLSPCGTFWPPGKRTMATPELTIEHLAKILRTSPLFKAGSRWLDVRVCQPHHVIIAGARQAVIGIICYLGMLSPSSIATQSSVSIHYCGRHCHRGEQHHPQQRTARGISCKNILPDNNTIFFLTITKNSSQQ